MKKKIVSVLLTATMLVGICSGCGKSGGSSEAKQNEDSNKITLMTQDTTYGKAFDEYIQKAEEATGLEIETIACPTNTDDRQAKITTILSSGDDSIDVITINDEMMSAFKNTGYLEPLQDTVMTPEVMKQAVELIDGRAQTECSGNITKENIQKICEIGVDFVSSGALTHSAPILDISMKNLHAV